MQISIGVCTAVLVMAITCTAYEQFAPCNVRTALCCQKIVAPLLDNDNIDQIKVCSAATTSYSDDILINLPFAAMLE